MRKWRKTKPRTPFSITSKRPLKRTCSRLCQYMICKLRREKLNGNLNIYAEVVQPNTAQPDHSITNERDSNGPEESVVEFRDGRFRV